MGFGFVLFFLYFGFVGKEQVQIMVEAKPVLSLFSQGSLHCMGLTAFMVTLKYQYPICNFLEM